MNEKAKYHHKKDTYTLFIVFSWDLVLDIVYGKKKLECSLVVRRFFEI